MRTKFVLLTAAISLVLAACSNAKVEEAERLGFSSEYEMEDIQSKGWHTYAQYRADETERAKRLGFIDMDELHGAESAGIMNPVAYRKHKAEEDTKFEAEEAAKEAMDNGGGSSAKSNVKSYSAKAKIPENPNNAKSLDEHYGSDAEISCGQGADDYLRQIAKHDFKWDDDATGMFGVKFGSYLPKVQRPGVITYMSDRAKLQNGFGAFTRITLYCVYDTNSDKVLKFYTDSVD